MNRQLPRGLAVFLILIGTIGALFVVGKVTPQAESGPKDPLIGRSAPTDAVMGANNTSIRLTDFKGKVVLVNFWATWCGPCRMEIPDLVKLQAKYAAKGFTVVGISQDNELGKALDFAKNNQMDYPIALGTPELKQSFGGVEAIPATFLIDRDGKIAWSIVGLTDGEILDAEVQKLL
jgi:thiol-disulfide isomerase/thioredoxin